ncbi:MAG: hypothetical protein QNL68_02635 [Akkermansiaceae bacterium]
MWEVLPVRPIELEHLIKRGSRNGVLMKYELLTGLETDATGYHIGLLDLDELRKKHTETKDEK